MSNYTLKKLKNTEQLIIALLVGDSWIEDSVVGHELYFKLSNEKSAVLKTYINYMELYNLNLTLIDDEQNIFCLKNSFVLERIIREWCNEANELCAVDPTLINNNVFVLWTCLFAEKVNGLVRIRHNLLSKEMQSTISFVYKQHIDSVKIDFSNEYFYLSDLNNVFLYSIQSNRPSYETFELSQLLNEGEIQTINKMKDKQEGGYLNAYC